MFLPCLNKEYASMYDFSLSLFLVLDPCSLRVQKVVKMDTFLRLGSLPNKGTGQNKYTRAGPTFGVGGEVLKDTTYLRTLPTTFYWLLNLS